MIPAEFDYRLATSLTEAITTLAADPEAKLIAGGHSLVPLMKLRLAAPTTLVDIGRLSTLRGVERAGDRWRIGALTRHADLADTAALGVIARAASLIADPQVRNRGTLGGSLAHGDPASDLPAVILALDGIITAQGPNGQREIAAAELFQDYFTTALAPDEVLTAISVPALDGWGWGYHKFTRRVEDWAVVGVLALVKARANQCADVRIGLTNMGSVPLRATAAEEALRDGPLDETRIAAAASRTADATEPQAELNASPDYKRHLAEVLCRRALREAAAAAKGEQRG